MQTSIATFSLIYMNAFIHRAEETGSRAKYTQDTWPIVNLATLGKYLKRPQARKYKIQWKEKGQEMRGNKKKRWWGENMFIL